MEVRREIGSSGRTPGVNIAGGMAHRSDTAPHVVGMRGVDHREAFRHRGQLLGSPVLQRKKGRKGGEESVRKTSFEVRYFELLAQ